MSICYVYVLRSAKTRRRYIGVSVNHERRLAEHNSGQTTSTAAGVPWRVIYVETHDSRASAVRRERFLKSGQGRQFLDKLERAERPPEAEGRGFESRQPD